MTSTRISRIPLIWCVAVTLLLGSAYRHVRWSYVDSVNNLTAAADHRSWGEALSDVLTRSVEYRPLLDLAIRGAYRVIGLNLGTYKVLVALEFLLVLMLLVAIFRPVGWRHAVAAIIALGVVAGLHTSRVLFLFVPLNAYATSMLMVLGAILLVMTPRLRGGYEWILLPLTLLALLWLEVGVLILPVVMVAWLIGAPGASWRSVAASLSALTIYLGGRFLSGPGVGLSSPDTGLGFSAISSAESEALFQHAPWLFWIYNSGATLLTVLASEPRAGEFRFIASLLRGAVPSWMWLHVLSSLCTTAIIAGALPMMWSRPLRDRVVAAAGAVLVIGGSLLGFLYTRDRIALPVGIGYAMMLYVALSAMLDRTASRRWGIPVGAVVIALISAWSIRTGEAYFALRDVAWDYHLEWTEREEAIRANHPITERLRASALKRRPPDPRQDPVWTYTLFERRFDPAAR